jgi:hypothetical protein
VISMSSPKPGVDPRTDATGGYEGAVVEKWDPDTVQQVTTELGREPTPDELRALVPPEITEV